MNQSDLAVGQSRRPLRLVPVALALFAIALTGACASGGSSGSDSRDEDRAPVPGQRRNVMRVDAYRPVEIFNEPGVGVRTIPVGAETAWRVLGGVYEQLGVPVTEANPRAMLLGNPGYLVRRVDGDRMNAFIDCGSDFSGPLANQYDITLSLTTKLTPKGPDSTEVLTVLEAYGRPRAVSGNTVHCQSRGVLEMKVAQVVAEVLGQGL